MDNTSTTLCAKCFKAVTSNSIKCHLCKSKFHLICAKVDIKLIDLFNQNDNVVYNCKDCLSATSEMISLISSISKDLRELKNQTVSKLCEDVKELKVGINELAKNLEKKADKQEMQSSNRPIVKPKNNNNIANQRSLASVVVSGTSKSMLVNQCNDDASSITSYPTAASEVESNMIEADNNHHEWRTNVNRRKRRNRVLVYGQKSSNDLAVVDKKKYLHISSFLPSVKPEEIIEFIEKNTEISKNHLECTRLVKKDVDVTTLKHVNFKLGVSSCFYNEIIKSTLWPMNTKVRPFVFFPREPANLQNVL